MCCYQKELRYFYHQPCDQSPLILPLFFKMYWVWKNFAQKQTQIPAQLNLKFSGILGGNELTSPRQFHSVNTRGDEQKHHRRTRGLLGQEESLTFQRKGRSGFERVIDLSR